MPWIDREAQGGQHPPVAGPSPTPAPSYHRQGLDGGPPSAFGSTTLPGRPTAQRPGAEAAAPGRTLSGPPGQSKSLIGSDQLRGRRHEAGRDPEGDEPAHRHHEVPGALDPAPAPIVDSMARTEPSAWFRCRRRSMNSLRSPVGSLLTSTPSTAAMRMASCLPSARTTPSSVSRSADASESNSCRPSSVDAACRASGGRASRQELVRGHEDLAVRVDIEDRVAVHGLDPCVGREQRLVVSDRPALVPLHDDGRPWGRGANPAGGRGG